MEAVEPIYMAFAGSMGTVLPIYQAFAGSMGTVEPISTLHTQNQKDFLLKLHSPIKSLLLFHING